MPPIFFVYDLLSKELKKTSSLTQKNKWVCKFGCKNIFKTKDELSNFFQQLVLVLAKQKTIIIYDFQQ